MTTFPAASTQPVTRWVNVVLRLRFVVLLLAGTVPGLWHLHTTGELTDWNYFRDAARILAGQTGDAPLSLYAVSPETQIGPPAVLLALPLALLDPRIGQPVVVLLLGSCLALSCRLLERAAGSLTPSAVHTQLTVLAGGLFASIYWWRVVADFTHVEDVLAIAVTCVVLSWNRTRTDPSTPWLATVLLGIAAAGKPWAVGFLPLAGAFGGPVRIRGLRVVVGGLVAVLWWAPFLIAAPGTLSALSSFSLRVWDESPLALVGLAGESFPDWVRPLQFAVAFGLAGLAVARGRAHLVPFVAVAARLGLDPQSWDYYLATVAVACLAADVLRRGRPGPWLTIVSVFVLYDVRWVILFTPLEAALQALPLVAAVVMVARTDEPLLSPTSASPHRRPQQRVQG
ncbi:hypothetical protein OG218_24950 [Kineococcus sp. NBC_00420]|uniref:hypothetical protein n=1 Tax=Kineococcus sp. NBC_00420 TaxID=2903564 RepID=UPI002E248515